MYLELWVEAAMDGSILSKVIVVMLGFVSTLAPVLFKNHSMTLIQLELCKFWKTGRTYETNPDFYYQL